MVFNPPPEPSYDREYEDLENIYRKALSRIRQQLSSVDPDDLVLQEYYQTQIYQLTSLIQELNTDSKEWIETTLSEVFLTASAGALVSMGIAETLEQAREMVGYSTLHKQRVEAIIADTFEDVLQATTYMDKSLKQLVREVQAEVLRVAVAQQRVSRDMVNELRTDLTKIGFSKSLLDDHWRGIIDARGNRWDLTTYVKMLTRTKVQRTQIEGVRQMLLEHGEHDLAIISSHNAKDACRHFENMIISLDGLTEGFPTLAEVRASGLIFHPNCQHTVHAIGDLDALPPNLMALVEKANKSGRDAMSRADEIKRRDNHERYLRNKKRKK